MLEKLLALAMAPTMTSESSKAGSSREEGVIEV